MAKVLQKADRRQLSHLDVAVQGTKRMLPKSASPAVASLDGGNCLSSNGGGRGGNSPLLVPVVSSTGKPLMPCHPARARELVRRGRALRRFSKGIFYIKLLDRAEGDVQQVACGIDPGSKKEGLTVKSAAHTFLNIQADAVWWVKEAVEVRRMMRHDRRGRHTPCRQPQHNRTRGGLMPSTRARWGWKLRLATWLSRLYPISRFVVEDIRAKTTGRRRWDRSFSPLEVGKKWFYEELGKLAPVETWQGWQTKELRELFYLEKTNNKMAEVFEAHCVDSWVLAASWTGWQPVPDNTRLLCVTPLQFRRRRLHMLQPGHGGVRRRDGGTRSLGLKRGSIIKHSWRGLAYVGGTMEGKVSLHSLKNGHRITKEAKLSDCEFFAYASWRTRFIPVLKV